MEDTIGDFWRMVWQENVLTIVMLTHFEDINKERCAKYFPVIGGSTEVHACSFKISRIVTEKRSSCQSTLFSITNEKANVTRYCTHVWVANLIWPDKGVI